MLKLEVFEIPAAPKTGQAIVIDSDQLEEARLQAYESGYEAGWDDAAAALSDDQSKMTAELANNLQRLSFTYQEARAHVLKSIRPVFTQMTTQFLPELAQETLAPIILDTLMPLVEGISEAPVRITLNPIARPAVENLLSQAAGLPLIIHEEPMLGEGQVYLRLGDTEQRIDMGQALADITQAVHDYFDYVEKDNTNG